MSGISSQMRPQTPQGATRTESPAPKPSSAPAIPPQAPTAEQIEAKSQTGGAAATYTSGAERAAAWDNSFFDAPRPQITYNQTDNLLKMKNSFNQTDQVQELAYNQTDAINMV